MYLSISKELVLAASEETKNPLLPEPYDIVYSLIALLVVFWVFWKFVLPKYNKVMEERKQLIEGGIERAEKTQAEANKKLEEYKAQLKEATDEAKTIREAAKQDGKKLIEQMRADGEAESNRIIENANRQLAAEKQQVISELRSEIGLSAGKLTEKIVGESLTKEANISKTVDSFLQELDNLPK